MSFDLPRHGERKDEPEPCDIWQGIKDLERIAAFAFGKWQNVNLFACSIGAFLALHAYADKTFYGAEDAAVVHEWLAKVI